MTKLDARGDSGAGATTFFRVVYDGRFPESVAFASASERAGERVHRIDGDISSFWYRELDLAWRGRPAPVAGLTAHGPLFCLERWAWDAGLRVLFKAEHRRAGRSVEHRLSGPSDIVAGFMESQQPSWIERAAGLARAAAASAAPYRQGRRVTPASPFDNPDSEPLFTWVIGLAPAAARSPISL